MYVLNVSPLAARLMHLELWHAGVVCHVDLPFALGALRLTGRVVWTRLDGTEQTVAGERRCYCDSGIEFTGLFVLWVAVGLGAGYMAESVMRGGGYGLIGDLALGLVGSILGSVIFQALGVSPSAGLVVLAVVALLGAAVVISGQRMLWHAHA